MNSKLEVQGLSYSYHSMDGETKALSNISFQVEEGEFLAVVGPSGCGKSTLLSILCGLLVPEEGSVLIDGEPVKGGSPRIGYMLQRDHLFEWRDIFSNACLGLEIRGQMDREHREKAERLLKTYGLLPFKNKKPSELSGGMRQRAALIRTLALDPDILLLDEPFSALDYQTRLAVCDDISSIIRENRKTAVLVTHDLCPMNNRETLAQRTFVAEQRRYRRRIAAGRILLFFAFLAVWEASADTGLLDDFIFSSPSRALRCFFAMASDGSVFPHLGATLLETVVSFFLVTALGLGGALALWESRTASDLLEPYLVMLNSLPKSALAPLLIVWLGSNMRTIVTAAVSVAVFGSVLTLYQGFLSMDPDQEKLIYSLGGTRRDVLRKALLPGSIPLIVSNMKVNAGLCLVGVMIGEFLAADKGLGYLIIYGSQVFKMDLVIMSIVILCLMAALLYQGIAFLEKKVSRRL